MQIPLFTALQSVNVSDEKATEVVNSLESHLAMKITEANAPLLAKLDAMEISNKANFDILKWLFSALIAIFGLSVGVLTFLSHHH
ncbi:hypothetical protein [Neokomagataea anthophila]|uniref:DUF1640 domain-containing protein n=1 Tax=Neokomagataea anthophila TaxID=2826925 RepID=A0ABS5E9G4_9PROT|nr:hypothetical protein [Neokomagataea anthophila]MBR0560532.1 hypothetical protein [Neokomagataea anthophila]